MTAHFPDAASATAYRNACDVAEGLPRAGVPAAPYPYGWTMTWAEPVERDGAWSVPVHPEVPVPEGVTTVSEEIF